MSCKVCLREYEDRPNDMCDNYLHWQAFVYQLEIKNKCQCCDKEITQIQCPNCYWWSDNKLLEHRKLPLPNTAKNAENPPKFAVGTHVKITEDPKSPHDHGVWFEKFGIISCVRAREKHRPQAYMVKMNGGVELKVYECDLEILAR